MYENEEDSSSGEILEPPPPPVAPPPCLPPRIVRKHPIRRVGQTASMRPRASPTLSRRVTSSACESLSRSPNDSFPHLLTGLSLQLRRKTLGAATSAATATSVATKSDNGGGILDTVFLNVPNQSLFIKIGFKDRGSLCINPLHVQYTEIVTEAPNDDKPTSDYSRLVTTVKIILRYGTKISLEELVFTASVRSLAEILEREIRNLKSYVLSLPYNIQIEMFLNHQFNLINNLSVINSDSLCSFMKNVTGYINDKTIRNYVSCDKAGLDRNEFITIYRTLLNMQKQQSKALTVLFYKSICNNDRRQGRMGVNSFEMFLKHEQNEGDPERLSIIASSMEKYTTRPKCRRSSVQAHLTFEDFLDYLFSPQNGVLESREVDVMGAQDDSQPLSDYYINSSHNTYLTGNQLKSDSSVDIYARLLRRGVRCVELDCWDGSDGQPVITHGNTLCSRIRFVDVVRCIAHNAFADGNLYPVILSIENHCSIQQQTRMAEIFKEELKEMLITEPIAETSKANRLPSPKQLFGKILLKDKKLSPPLTAVRKTKDSIQITRTISSSKDDLTRMEDEKLMENTIMVLFENYSEPEWKSCSAMMNGTVMELSWIETILGPESSSEDCQEITHLDVQSNQQNVLEERYRQVEQQIGIFELRRDQAEVLLSLHSGSVEGSFVVRRNERHNVVLSVLHNGLAYHVQADVFNERDQMFYRIGDITTTLDNLIEHYRKNPMIMITKDGPSSVLLKDPIPVEKLFQVQDWYIPELNDTMTAQLLNAGIEDGVFLLRDNMSRTRRILSFTSRNLVYHVYIDNKDTGIEIGGVEVTLKSVSDIIDYYRTRPIFDSTILNVPYGSSTPDSGELTDDDDEEDKYVRDFDNCSRYLSGLELNIEPIILNAAEVSRNSDLKNRITACGESELASQIRKQQKNEKIINSTVDLKNAIIEPQEHETPLPNCSKKTPCLKISCPSTSQVFYMASEDEHILWNIWNPKLKEVAAGEDCTNAAENPNVSNNRKKIRIAPELSELVIYCQSVPFSASVENDVINFSDGPCTSLSSFNETKAKSVMVEHNRMAFQRYHQRQLSRIYPKATRTDSSNFNPVPFWCSGAQLVALNFQTPDKELQINHGWFLQNGSCGYVLKPKCLTEGCFDPQTAVPNDESFQLIVTVLSGRHLAPTSIKGVSLNTFIKLEIIGCPIDCAVGTTEVCVSNAFNPSWDESFDLGIVHRPQLAVLRISVYNHVKNPVPAAEFLCQATLPVAAMRVGYRSVAMRNGFGEIENGLSALLIHVEKKEVEKEDNFLQVMIKSLHNLHSKEKSLRDGSCSEDLSENEKFEVEQISEEIRILEERLARFLSLKNPSTIPPSPKTAKKSSKHSENRKTGPALEPGNVATADSNVSFGALPRKVPGRKFKIDMNK